MPDQNFLAGPPMGGGTSPDQGGGPTPPQGGGGGQRPVLKSVLMQNVDSQNGGESITFVFADGFKATETLKELLQMGVDPQAMQSVGQVIDDAADKVHQINKGGGPPAQQGGGGGMMGGGPAPQGMMGP